MLPDAATLEGGGTTPEVLISVLVVEDDAMLRRVIVRTLQTWGFSVVEAIDGGAALDRVCERMPGLDVVLLDIWLPVLDGVEVARRLQRDCPKLPIVACSAAMDAQVVSDLTDAGVRHFLPKPYSADALHEILLRATEVDCDPA